MPLKNSFLTVGSRPHIILAPDVGLVLSLDLEPWCKLGELLPLFFYFRSGGSSESRGLRKHAVLYGEEKAHLLAGS